MDDMHCTLLRTNRMELLHDVQPSEMLLSYLYAMEVLSEESVEEIKAKDTRNKKVAAILDRLPRCGPDAFQAFLEGLVQDGQRYVADKLEKSIADQHHHRKTEIDGSESGGAG